MPLYRRKPTTVDAEQFVDPHMPPRGALYNHPSFYVVTMQGRPVPVSIGEWIVAEPDGEHYYPIADVQSRALYERVD
jgi:hypothetical protein